MIMARVERNLGNLDSAREHCRQSMMTAGTLLRLNRQAKEPVVLIDVLHSEAKLLGVPDTTLTVQVH